MNGHYTPLRDAAASHGGKARGLRALILAQVPVPEGIALDDAQVARLLAGDAAAAAALCAWLAQRPAGVAVRSSALNEDGREQSFAGIFETRLNIAPTLDAVVAAVSDVAGSGRSDRAESYSGARSATIPVVVQDMVLARVSGVAFSRAVLPDGRDAAYVEWVDGAGEQLVSGQVAPASIAIPWDKETGHLDLSDVRVHKELPDPAAIRPVLGMLEWLASSSDTSWDVEWSVDMDGRAYALQLRPVSRDVLTPARLRLNKPIPASPGTATGLARVVDDGTHAELTEGEVLVARITETDYVAAMARASAIVTEEGGLLSHAAIIARELGKPCVVGVRSATSLIQTGVPVRVDGSGGSVVQGDLKLGGEGSGEVDWASVYLYDRGIEVEVAGTPIYIEPTLDDLLVHVDEIPSGAASLAIERFARRRFNRAPSIVESDRRIWAREWRRFEQLQTVQAVRALFSSAIAGWDIGRTERAIGVLEDAARRLGEAKAMTPLDRLFNGEAGAALHALVSATVEGEASWAAYRDTASWREENGVTFGGMLAGGLPINAGGVTEILAVLERLARLRNGAFALFRKVSAFDGDYFGIRAQLVEEACVSSGVAFADEDRSLGAIYRTPAWSERDAALHLSLSTSIQTAIAG